MKLQLYFLRHGQTTHSRDEKFCGCGTEAQLTNDGLEMAHCFGNKYASRDWTKIFCSPQIRAQKTAEPLCLSLGVKPDIREGLREINYGKWEDRTLVDVRAEYGNYYDTWVDNPSAVHPPDGETADEIAARALSVIEEIKTRYASGNFLLVSHKATIRITLCALLGIDLARFRQRIYCPVASLSHIELTSSGAMLKSLGDVSHLDVRLQELPGS